MKIHGHSRHTVDILFPLAVLFVFAVSAFAVLILSARIYAAQVEHSATSAEQIPVAYLREKLRQKGKGRRVRPVSPLPICGKSYGKTM